MSDTDEWIRTLGCHWDVGAALWNIRQGRFDEKEMRQLTEDLRSIDLGKVDALRRELVSLIWYIPLLLLWNRPRVLATTPGISSYDNWVAAIETEITRILGDPTVFAKELLEKDTASKLTSDLAREWLSSGFFAGVMTLTIDSEAAERTLLLLASLGQIDEASKECIDRSLVALLWYIPVLMEKTTELLRAAPQTVEFDLASFEILSDSSLNEVSAVLGIP